MEENVPQSLPAPNAGDAPAKGKGKGKKGKGKAAGDPPPPPRRLPEGDLTQPMLKPLLPPGASLWHGNVAGTWNSHYPPFPRVSAAWALYGHRGAAVKVLRDVWSKHLMMHAQTVADCPIQGLFVGDGVAAVPAVAP